MFVNIFVFKLQGDYVPWHVEGGGQHESFPHIYPKIADVFFSIILTEPNRGENREAYAYKYK